MPRRDPAIRGRFPGQQGLAAEQTLRALRAAHDLAQALGEELE
jgi:hypothetical protein